MAEQNILQRIHDEAEKSESLESRISIEEELTNRIKYQRKWREISMWLYICSTVFSILGSSSAAVLAAMGYSIWAAIFAAFAGIWLSVEKSLLFREKWKLHLRILTSFENLLLKFKSGSLAPLDTVIKIEEIADKYANDLPFEKLNGKPE